MVYAYVNTCFSMPFKWTIKMSHIKRLNRNKRWIITRVFPLYLKYGLLLCVEYIFFTIKKKPFTTSLELFVNISKLSTLSDSSCSVIFQ